MEAVFKAGIVDGMTKVALSQETKWRALGARLGQRMKERGVEPYIGINPMKISKSLKAGQEVGKNLAKTKKGRLYQRALKGPAAVTRLIKDPGGKLPGIREIATLSKSPEMQAAIQGLRRRI